jgi:hypothetical protein
MFSIAFSSLFGQDAAHRRPADAESGRNRARRLTSSVHPLRQGSVLLIKRLGPSDVLPACPTCHLCRCTAFPAKLHFKFGQAGKHYGDHAACGVGRIDGFAQRPHRVASRIPR